MLTTNRRRSYAIPQSFNHYAYVNNDPVNFVDPSGLDTCHTDPATGQTVCIPDINGGVVTVNIPSYLYSPSYAGIYQFRSDTDLWRTIIGIPPSTGTPTGGGTTAPPQKPTPEKPKQDYQALYDKVKSDCLAREKAKADGFRAAYRDQYGHRVVRSMGSGAFKGVVRGAYAGAIGGEFIEPAAGGLPGAIYGAVVGGIFGAASGVFSSVVKEPIYRGWYDYWNYRPALNTSQLDCDAEARTAVFDAQH